MSWMDSWSRPSKHAVTPPPLYITGGDDVPYCHSCGRVISSRRTHASQEVKYCSARCRNTKPGQLDRKIEAAFAALLDGKPPEDFASDSEGSVTAVPGLKEKDKKKKKPKGDPRIIVECSEVEALLFPHEKDPAKVFGRKKNRAARGFQEKPEDWKSVDMVDEPETRVSLESESGDSAFHLESAEGYGGGKVRPSQMKSDVNGSVGGEKGWAERTEETEEAKAKRLEGEKRAKEREMVRRAARRGCAFGFLIPEESGGDNKRGSDAKKDVSGERRKCEAVMKGTAVEASFAKGEWGIRWREKV